MDFFNFSESLRCDPGLNDYSCCTEDQPCGEGEGDCDDDSDCGPGLICGDDNCHWFNKQSAVTSDCCVRPPEGLRVTVFFCLCTLHQLVRLVGS